MIIKISLKNSVDAAHAAALQNTACRDAQFAAMDRLGYSDKISFIARYMLSVVTLMNTCRKTRYVVTSFMTNGPPTEADIAKVDAVLRRMLMMGGMAVPPGQEEKIDEDLAKLCSITFRADEEDATLAAMYHNDLVFCNELLKAEDFNQIAADIIDALN